MKEKHIEAYLSEGEESVWRGTPKENDFLWCKLFNMLPVIILWLAAETAIVAYTTTAKLLLDEKMNTYYYILMIAAIVLHLVPTAMWFFSAAAEGLKIKGEEYMLTDGRVIVMPSCNTEGCVFVRREDVDDIVLKRSLAELIFGTGRIVFVTENGNLVFHSVAEADKIFRKIYRNVMKERAEEDE